MNVVRNTSCDDKYRKLMRMYERIFTSLIGHENNEVRTDAVRMLNVIVDGLDWQYENPHVPVIK